MLLIWNTTELEDILDSAQSRDQLQNFTQTDKPLEKETRILHPQIIFQSFCTTEEINIPQFYVCNMDLNLHHSLPAHIQQFKILTHPSFPRIEDFKNFCKVRYAAKTLLIKI